MHAVRRWLSKNDVRCACAWLPPGIVFGKVVRFRTIMYHTERVEKSKRALRSVMPGPKPSGIFGMSLLVGPGPMPAVCHQLVEQPNQQPALAGVQSREHIGLAFDEALQDRFVERPAGVGQMQHPP